jgi:ABC-type transporter Mla subunit MlaD
MATERYGIDVEINAELSRFERNMRRAGQTVETAVSGMDRQTKRAARQFQNLEGKLNPTARAANRLARDTEKVQRALDKGAVSSQRAAKLQRQLNDQYEQAIARTRQLDNSQDRLNASSVRTSRGMGRFGASAQNAAFQVSDFATQVSAGGSASRALAQQLPQLIGGFGPLAAAIGAVVSVGAALAPTLLDIGENSDTAGDKTRTYGQSLEAVNDIVKRANDASKTRAQRLRDEGNAALEGARKELEAAQAKLEALRAGEATGFGRDILQFFGVDPEGKSEAINPRQQRAREQALDRLGERAQTASERFDELKARLDTATESLNANAKAADENAERQQSVLSSLREQIELEEMSRRERFITTNVMEAQNRAMEEGNLLRQEEIARIEETAGGLFDVREELAA